MLICNYWFHAYTKAVTNWFTAITKKNVRYIIQFHIADYKPTVTE